MSIINTINDRTALKKPPRNLGQPQNQALPTRTLHSPEPAASNELSLASIRGTIYNCLLQMFKKMAKKSWRWTAKIFFSSSRVSLPSLSCLQIKVRFKSHRSPPFPLSSYPRKIPFKISFFQKNVHFCYLSLKFICEIGGSRIWRSDILRSETF